MEKKPDTLNKKESYSLRVQNLMGVIPTSTVEKHVTNMGDFSSIVQWSIGGYIIYSSFYWHDVYSTSPNGKKHFEFFLEAKDYIKIKEACEKRRAELLEQTKSKKK